MKARLTPASVATAGNVRGSPRSSTRGMASSTACLLAADSSRRWRTRSSDDMEREPPDGSAVAAQGGRVILDHLAVGVAHLGELLAQPGSHALVLLDLGGDPGEGPGVDLH